MIATVVDWAALRDVVVGSLAAGVGITAAFSFAILSLARFADMRRVERVGVAWAYAGLAILGVAVSGAAVVFGIHRDDLELGAYVGAAGGPAAGAS